MKVSRLEKALLIFTIILFSSNLIAKDKPPMVFGEIKPIDFEFNFDNYPQFNKNANAVVLCDYGQEFSSEIGNNYQTRTVVNKRILILNDKGKTQANIAIQIRSKGKSVALNKSGSFGSFWTNGKGEGLFKIKAASYNIGENGEIVKTELDEKNIYFTEATSLYELAAVTFAIPNVKKGSIIEYSYTRVTDNFSLSRRWTFQESIPTIHSEYRVAYNETDSYAVMKRGMLRNNIKISESNLTTKQFRKFKQIIFKFTLDTIPAVPDYEYLSNIDNYRTCIILQLNRYWNYNIDRYRNIISTWEELAKEYMDEPMLGKQLFKYKAFFDEIRQSLPVSNSSIEDIQNCFNFVRDYFNWNGKYSRLPDENLKKVFDNRSASDAEINLFLCRLLRECGVNANPAFTSTRDNGWVNKIYPFVLQFNHTICTVELGNKIFFLDASQKQSSYNIPPPNIIDSKVFIINLADPKIVKVNSNILYYTSISVNAKVGDNKISGDINLDFKGYAALKARNIIATEKEETLLDYYLNTHQGVEGKTKQIENFDNKNLPLNVSLDFNYPDGFQYVDSLLVLEPGKILDIFENPFTAESRNIPVEMNYGRQIKVVYNITLPLNYYPENLPEPKSFIMNGGAAIANTVYSFSDNILQIKAVLRTNKLVYEIDEYDDLKKAYNTFKNSNLASIAFSKKQNN